MTSESDRHRRSPVVGDLNLPGDGNGPDPHERVPMLVELNLRFPGGLTAVRAAFYELWGTVADRAGGGWPAEATEAGLVRPPVPAGLALIAPALYQCVLSRDALDRLVTEDRRRAVRPGGAAAIFRVWPDHPLQPQIDRSSRTVKADAAWNSYHARGEGIVWAVVDSGIDAAHPHFTALALAGAAPPLHQDFSYLVNPDAATAAGWQGAPLTDASGHGTHVAGIISGCTPADVQPVVADSREPLDGAYVRRRRVGTLSGMAPGCQLVSLKVMRKIGSSWMTSAAAVIRALTYLRTEVNVDPGLLRVHGVNLSLGTAWAADQYAAGQSPLCRAVNQLVASGVLVVVSSGNNGARTAAGDSANTSAVMGSITEPAHAEDCIAVGSTHREAPHTFGVTWTSGKGPTLDGRMKPDVVAPGEWIASAACGEVAAQAGLPDDPAAPAYAELSGTSMAAPHVSGVLAAFLSARPEFIGRPQQVKRMLTANATDLGRERYAQGAGLVDLMRMLANV